MQNILLATVLAIVGLTGCGKTESKANPVTTFKLQGVEYVPLDKAALGMSPDGVGGTGSLVFRLPRPKDNNYKLSFTVDKGGSVTLVTNADNALKGGANLVLGRSAADKLTVMATTGDKVCTPGDLKCDLSASFTDVSAAGTVDIQFDVHEHGHIIYFVNGVEKEEFAIDRVAGTFWGLKLKDAVVFSAVANNALKPE